MEAICLMTTESLSLLRFQKKRLLNLLKATLYIRERNCFETRLYKNGFAAELRKYAQPKTFGKENLDRYYCNFKYKVLSEGGYEIFIKGQYLIEDEVFLGCLGL